LFAVPEPAAAAHLIGTAIGIAAFTLRNRGERREPGLKD
jgi:hypothetical protein